MNDDSAGNTGDDKPHVIARMCSVIVVLSAFHEPIIVRINYRKKTNTIHMLFTFIIRINE